MSALLRQGHTVLVPFGDDQPFDLVVHDRQGRYWRVQCKTGRERDGRVMFNSCSTDHGRGRLDYVGRADVFGVWCPTVDRVFIVPVADAAGYVTTLRLRPTRNAQARRIRHAEDFAVERWLAAAPVAA
jgi:hypothetical protein